MVSRKMVLMNLSAGKELRCRYTEWNCDTTGEGEDGKIESSIKIYTVPCVKQIASGKLLCNTGSSAWYSLIICWEVGQKLKTKGMYTYLWLIHIVVWQK